MVYVYHGTSPINLKRIKQNGLCEMHEDIFREWPEFQGPGIYVTENFETALGFAMLIPKRSRLGLVRTRGHPSDIPKAILRIDSDDNAWDDCDAKYDHIEGSYAIRCKRKCIKPKSSEVCLIPPSEEWMMRFDKSLIQEWCESHWKKLRFE